MATVRPFRALRPDRKYAKDVVSLPYDVMNRQEAAEMAAGDPYSFLHICRSEIDMPEDTDPYDKAVYERARDNIGKFIDEGIMKQDESPSFYIYRQIMNGNVQTGIVGCVSVDEYLDNTIKKHELTRVEKEQDRINHFDICNADTEPVFLTYRKQETIRSLTEAVCAETPEYDITGDDGVRHMLWIVGDEEKIGAVTAAFRDVPSLYIADGHHRSASACGVGEKRRKENPGYDGSEEFNYFMAVIFPDEDLRVYDYNRVVQDLNGLSEQEFLIAAENAGFEVSEAGTAACRPERPHEFGMLLGETWYKLTASESIIPDDPIGSLDVSVLQDNLLGPVLRIDDPRTDSRIDFVGGIRGMHGLEKRVAEGMAAAFAVYPVSISSLMDVADNGMVMPPKSTWFEPKLGSGLFMHML